MDDRKKQILQAITDDYIASAEPVGSRTIARKYRLGVSPATIRNEMADLEDAGYLEQPHTSAGRIPSDKGYRFYVDALMDPAEIPPEERFRLQFEVASRQRAADEMIHHTARLLSLLTRYTSVVLVPAISETICRHVQLVPIDANHLLVVLVTEPGFVQNRIIEVSEPIDVELIEHLNAVLRNHLRGVTLRDVTGTVIAGLRAEIDNNPLFYAVMDLISEGLERDDQVYLEGAINIFEHPEFRDVERAKVLLRLLEEREAMSGLLAQLGSRPGLTVTIGSENPRTEMQECSLVTAAYSSGGHVIGILGLIGPTRMDYARVVSMVEYVAESLSELLSPPSKR